jgi:hypothetical protein
MYLRSKKYFNKFHKKMFPSADKLRGKAGKTAGL